MMEIVTPSFRSASFAHLFPERHSSVWGYGLTLRSCLEEAVIPLSYVIPTNVVSLETVVLCSTQPS